MSLSLAQRKILALVPTITGICSAVGSSLIVADVARDRKKRRQVYSRLMLAMSCFDCVTSSMYALSTWPIPRGAGPVWAAGTVGTCTFQGFFIQLSLAAPLYNLCLALHYLAVIKHGWSDVDLARAERVAHPLIFAVAVGIAVAGLPLKMFNNANVWCWIAPDDRMDHPDRANVYRWVFYYVELWVIIVAVSATMILVVADVVRTEDRSAAFSADRRKTSMAGQVKRQALYYVSAFYVTWTFPTTLRILQTIDIPVPYAIYVCAVIFTPLQGFFNYLIYMRPRYLRQKREAARRRATLQTGQTPPPSNQGGEANVDAEVALAEKNRRREASPAGETPSNHQEEETTVDAEAALAEANRSHPGVVGSDASICIIHKTLPTPLITIPSSAADPPSDPARPRDRSRGEADEEVGLPGLSRGPDPTAPGALTPSLTVSAAGGGSLEGVNGREDASGIGAGHGAPARGRRPRQGRASHHVRERPARRDKGNIDQPTTDDSYAGFLLFLVSLGGDATNEASLPFEEGENEEERE